MSADISRSILRKMARRPIRTTLGLLVAAYLVAGAFYWMTNICLTFPSSRVTSVRFVGHTLHLPSAHIRSCMLRDYSDESDYNPATITLDAELPTFRPLPSRSKDRRNAQQNELRVALTGFRPDIATIDAAVKIGPVDLEQSLYYRRHAFGRGDPIPLHTTPSEVSPGLFIYEPLPDTGYRNQPEIYVGRDAEGRAIFVLECAVESASLHRSLDCKSLDESAFDNVKFHYYYNRAFLNQAFEIDRRVNRLVQDAIRQPDSKDDADH